MIVLKKCCLVLNGESGFDTPVELKQRITKENYDIIVAVDGGANHLYSSNIRPDYLVGDFDSLDKNILEYYRDMGVELEKHNVRKNETDSELAIILAKSKETTHIDMYEALGGRLDHEMANLLLLYYIKKMGIEPRIISKNLEIDIVVDEKVQKNYRVGDIVSIIPIGNGANGVSLCGFEYSLDNFDMEMSTPRGISNVVFEKVQNISVRDGAVLVFHYFND